MAVPVGWDSTYEDLCGENDPYGRSDTANKYAKTLWTNFIVEHNEDDGSHKDTGTLYKYECGSYTGNGSTQTISLADSTITIKTLKIVRASTKYQVYTTDEMATDETKVVGTAAFQSGLITDISTTGEFDLGSDDNVNANSITYYYSVKGT